MCLVSSRPSGPLPALRPSSPPGECPNRTRQKLTVFSDLASEVLWHHLGKVSSDSTGRNRLRLFTGTWQSAITTREVAAVTFKTQSATRRLSCLRESHRPRAQRPQNLSSHFFPTPPARGPRTGALWTIRPRSTGPPSAALLAPSLSHDSSPRPERLQPEHIHLSSKLCPPGASVPGRIDDPSPATLKPSASD